MLLESIVLYLVHREAHQCSEVSLIYFVQCAPTMLFYPSYLKNKSLLLSQKEHFTITVHILAYSSANIL